MVLDWLIAVESSQIPSNRMDITQYELVYDIKHHQSILYRKRTDAKNKDAKETLPVSINQILR